MSKGLEIETFVPLANHGLQTRFGWSHSKIGGYESPPPEEFIPWRLEEQYDFCDMRAWLLSRSSTGL